MDIYPILYSIENNRIPLSKEHSFAALSDYIDGWRDGFLAAYRLMRFDPEHPLLPGFTEFCREYYGDTRGIEPWFTLIPSHSGSDSAAYDKFFALYRDYRRLPELYSDPLYVEINTSRRIGGFSTLSRFLTFFDSSFLWFLDRSIEPPETGVFREFHAFVCEKLHTDSVNWQDAVKAHSDSDENALTVFYALYDEYCALRLQEKPTQRDKAELQILRDIRRAPQKYLGDINLDKLFTYLDGFVMCEHLHDPDYDSPLLYLNEFVMQAYGEWDCNISQILRNHTKSEEEAFFLFFSLVDEFLPLSPAQKRALAPEPPKTFSAESALTDALRKLRKHCTLSADDSFDSLTDYLHGYERAYREALRIPGTGLFHGFSEFVQNAYGDSRQNEPWERVIRAHTNSDKEAYEAFYQLYADHRHLPPLLFDRLYLAFKFMDDSGIASFGKIITFYGVVFPWFFEEESDEYKTSLFRGFGDFVQDSLHDEDNSPWTDAVRHHSENDEDALKLFSRLFREYCDAMEETR